MDSQNYQQEIERNLGYLKKDFPEIGRYIALEMLQRYCVQKGFADGFKEGYKQGIKKVEGKQDRVTPAPLDGLDVDDKSKGQLL